MGIERRDPARAAYQPRDDLIVLGFETRFELYSQDHASKIYRNKILRSESRGCRRMVPIARLSEREAKSE